MPARDGNGNGNANANANGNANGNRHYNQELDSLMIDLTTLSRDETSEE